MQAQLISLALKFAFGQLRKHPELIKDVTDKIPGRVDDFIIKAVLGL